MGVKELVAVEGWPDTHASMLYKDNIADHTATEAARLYDAGAVFVGLTTSPEFGSLNWTRTYIHGVTRNPWNLERTPGGSSGGSAAAVAVGMMPICTGSDGGGSIRTPSAYSGLFGFKVSFGRVGDAGDFDCGLTSVPGPICRTVRDAPATSTRSPAPPTSTRRRCRVLRSSRTPCSLRPHNGCAACGVVVDAGLRSAIGSSAEARSLAEDAGIELVDVDFRFRSPARRGAS
jgi:aspartyl-tRNA(Asn)/glutamyl-tRNA(Gln) amidotransferase subunit A